MKNTLIFSILAVFASLLPLSAIADTTDQKWMTKVEVKKTGLYRFYIDVVAFSSENKFGLYNMIFFSK